MKAVLKSRCSKW